MADEPKHSWTEADLKALIGQHESIRTEFKSGKLLEDQQQNKWVADLSKEVSAFANTEGGELFLGINEDRKSKPRVAEEIDGILSTLGPERLQQLIEGNVFPYLPGLRVHPVKLTSIPDRVAFVIHVPQGSTAYQANDGRYYGRSEFEAKFLPDHEIRLRMSRGKVARAAVHLRLRQIVPARSLEAEVRTKHARAIEAFKTNASEAFTSYPEAFDALMRAHYGPDEIVFDLVVRNDGELTIRDPAVELREDRSASIFDGWKIQGEPLPARVDMRGKVVYPGDEHEVSGSDRHLRCEREVTLAEGDYVVRWRVFLDNSPPSVGEIDLGKYIQNARNQ